MRYKFSGKIKCMECGKKFKGKNERGKNKYICSGYDNYGKNFCERIVIDEAMLVHIVDMHFRKYEVDYPYQKVKEILVFKDKIFINYEEGSYSYVKEDKIIF